MRTLPFSILSALVLIIFISFHNFATLSTLPSKQSHHRSKAVSDSVEEMNKPVAGYASFWALGAPDQIIPPEFKTRSTLKGEEVDKRFSQALRMARGYCFGSLSSDSTIQRVAFQVESGGLVSEGKYLMTCETPNEAVRMVPDEPSLATSSMPDSTGKLFIRYPEINTSVQQSEELYQPDNELRFLTATTLAEDRCGSISPEGRLVRVVEFEVQSIFGSEGKYKIFCNNSSTGQMVSLRSIR